MVPISAGASGPRGEIAQGAAPFVPHSATPRNSTIFWGLGFRVQGAGFSQRHACGNPTLPINTVSACARCHHICPPHSPQTASSNQPPCPVPLPANSSPGPCQPKEHRAFLPTQRIFRISWAERGLGTIPRRLMVAPSVAAAILHFPALLRPFLPAVCHPGLTGVGGLIFCRRV